MVAESLLARSLEEIRSEFPILGSQVNGHALVYLDNAATSQKPQAVIEATEQFYAQQNSNVHRGVHHLSVLATRLYDKAREAVKSLLNARESSEIIFTKGCTEAINLVASSLGRLGWFGVGDVILVSTMEHHSNIVPWQLVADQVGAKVVPIPISDAGEIDHEAYLKLLGSHPVKLVALVAVSNSLGTINPVSEMTREAHLAGAKVLIDGAQAGPHCLLDVQTLDCEFLTLSCHKMYAPTGVGVLYGKRAELEALPPYQGGGDMIHTVSFERTTYAPLPGKFEAGTPNIAGVIGLGAAIEWIASLAGPEGSLRQRLERALKGIEAAEQDLTEYGTRALTEIPGLRITGTAKHKAGILAFVLDGVHPHDIGTILDGNGIAIRAGHHCCMPLMKRLGVPATARASLGVYNTRADIDALVAGVWKVKEMFA